VNLDLAVREPPLLRRNPFYERLSNVAWHKAAFILIWEGQSQASAIAYVGLVAFGPLWLAFGVMLAWSLVATVVFCAARERGYPNLLTMKALPERKINVHAVLDALGAFVRAWLAGLYAFVFARASDAFLAEKRGCCRARTLARYGVLGLGLVFFGVSTAEHLLRAAGYQGRRLLQLSLIGPFLNVPYRVMLSAALVAVVTDALHLFAV
jgi:hypothetical protein